MRPSVLLLCLLCTAFAGVPAAVATTPSPMARLPDRRDDGAPLTLEQAIDMVRQRFDARVVRAEEVHEGADLVYRIRLLAADGRVFTVRVNARSRAVD